MFLSSLKLSKYFIKQQKHIQYKYKMIITWNCLQDYRNLKSNPKTHREVINMWRLEVIFHSILSICLPLDSKDSWSKFLLVGIILHSKLNCGAFGIWIFKLGVFRVYLFIDKYYIQICTCSWKHMDYMYTYTYTCIHTHWFSSLGEFHNCCTRLQNHFLEDCKYH